MRELSLDTTGLRTELEAVAMQFSDMIRPLGDTTTAVPDSEWTVGEHAAHVAMAQKAFASIMDGAWVDYRDNAQGLAEFPERDAARLADLVVEATRTLLEVAARNEQTIRAHPGFSPRTMTQWTSYSLCHLLMHAYPVAQALGQPSPIHSQHLSLVLPFLEVVMPTILDKKEASKLEGRLEVRTTGGPCFSLHFSNGTLTVELTPEEPVDCELCTSPITFLRVITGLETQVAAAERGEWKVEGSRPELGLNFKKLLPNP